MRKVYILGGLRSHIGLKQGIFHQVQADELGAALLRKVIEKYALSQIDEIICGNAVGTGGNITRLMALKAGVAERVSACTIDMQCASAAVSIELGYAKVKSGLCDVVIAGGFESSSMQPLRTYATHDKRYTPDGYMVAQFSPEDTSALAMLEGAERTAEREGISRAELDWWPIRSHQLAKQARDAGVLDDCVVPLFGSTCDEGIRDKMSARLVQRLKPLLKEDGTLTAANSCLINDGAAFVVLCSENFIEEHSLQAQAEILLTCSSGVAPQYSPSGAIVVADRLLKKAGVAYEAVEAFEYNEAFAVIDVMFARRHPGLVERYNRFGGALAYGHPYGASGAIILLHLLKSLEVNHGSLGVCSVAGAGGLGSAILVKRV